MSDQNVGGALLRILGTAAAGTDKPSPASMDDAYLVIDSVLDSKEFRERCSMFYSLVSEVPEGARKNTLRALIIILQSKRHPKVLPPMDKGKTDYSLFKAMTMEYTSLCAPLPHSPWKDHVEAKYRQNASAELVRVSPHLAEVILALELLFGVRGALLTS